MKLTCDLCGGQLMVGSGGQTASCTVCGLLYSMDRLREKLGVAPAAEAEPQKPPVKVKISRKLPSVPRKEEAAPEIPMQEVTPPEEIPAQTPDEPVVCEDILSAVPLEEIFPDMDGEISAGEPAEEAVEEVIHVEAPVEEVISVEDHAEEAVPVEEPAQDAVPAKEPVEEQIPAEEPAEVPADPPAPRIPTSYWIPPMENPGPVLFAMELKSVAFSTIRGTILSGSVCRGSQILLGDNLCSVISLRPAQLKPGSYAELTISNCPSRNAMKNLVYVIGCTPELLQLPANALSYSGSAKAYMTRVLQTAFSDCQIEVTNAAAPGQPVAFTFYRNDRKQLTAILCHSKGYNSQAVLDILDRCRQEGVPTLRFFEDFWNNREYIIGRIRQAL